MSLEKQSLVGIFQLAVFCDVYIPGYYKPVLIKKGLIQKTLNVIKCMTNGCLGVGHNALVLCKMFVIGWVYVLYNGFKQKQNSIKPDRYTSEI